MNFLPIETVLFQMAFARDRDFQDTYSQTAFLDRDTGQVLWVFEDDEDACMESGIPEEENAATRKQIADIPGRYLELPGLDHGDHHEIFQNFLDSDWTSDEEAKTDAKLSYCNSIGGWIRAVNEMAVHAYYDFRDSRIKQMAELFLRKHGIEPQWR